MQVSPLRGSHRPDVPRENDSQKIKQKRRRGNLRRKKVKLNELSSSYRRDTRKPLADKSTHTDIQNAVA
jgi:hypothetical protein